MSNPEDKTMRDQSLVRPRQEDDGQQGDSRDVRQASPAEWLRAKIDECKKNRESIDNDIYGSLKYYAYGHYIEALELAAEQAEREGWTRTR